MSNGWYPNAKYSRNRNLYKKDFLSKNRSNPFVPKEKFNLFQRRIFIQTISVILIFFFAWGLFQLEGPIVNHLQEAMRTWFTKDTDLSPVFNTIKSISFYGDSFDRAGYEVFAPSPIGSLGAMTIPVSGTITQPFGWIMIDGRSAFHDGLIIEAPINTAVKACYAGTVLEIGENKLLGRYLVISHQDGLLSTYGYCNEILVQKEDKVEKAQVIARVGSLDKDELGKLYFETARLGEPINPMDLLGKDNLGI